ncbi:hypothetical protein BBF96_15750 [Anoxybacter fermentans]|uniref:Uncharacterized protein n=1 Tax=Anoxybacter fermentans TaxID=1323375 RepID=A0A3Q9HSP1_9FIRM|nr:tetratricopeptide repeat protein [Anoxybacter fermentans]AZR74696.1 hypothetical protein BBF96_15750 [Anoxybacter fermentans]
MSFVTHKEKISDYLGMARKYIGTNDFVNFMKNISIAEYLSENDRESLEETLFLLAEGFYKFGKYKEAYEVVNRILTLVENEKTRYRLLRTKGMILGKMGNLDAAIKIFEKLLENCSSEGWSLNNLAWIYLYKYQLESDTEYLPKVIQYGLKAVESFDFITDPVLKKSILINLGNAYWYCENYEKALEFFLKALEFVKDDPDPKILNNIGVTYARMRKIDKAEKYLRKAELIAERKKDYFELGQANLIRARIYEWNYNDYMKAKEYFLIAFDKFVLANALLEAYKSLKNILRLNEKLNRESIDILCNRLKTNLIENLGEEETLRLERRED